MTTAPLSPRRSHRPRRILLTVIATLMTLVVVGGLAVWRYGPRYSVYLLPPSPARYADDALKVMDEGYYATGPAWQQARARAVTETRHAKTYADTLPALRAALAVAGGRHSQVFRSGETLEDHYPGRPLPTTATVAGITTVTVPQAIGDKSYKQSYATTMAGGLDGASGKTSCGWIVDVRHNHGGDMGPMLAGLTPLLGSTQLGGFVDRTGKRTQLDTRNGTVLLGGNDNFSVGPRPQLKGPVAVLQGPDAGSSGEVVILAFHGAPSARSFGGPTAGYSSANMVYRLYDGTQMMVTTALDVDRTGTVHGGPITPDQAAPVDTAEEAATAWLRSQCH